MTSYLLLVKRPGESRFNYLQSTREVCFNLPVLTNRKNRAIPLDRATVDLVYANLLNRGYSVKILTWVHDEEPRIDGATPEVLQPYLKVGDMIDFEIGSYPIQSATVASLEVTSGPHEKDGEKVEAIYGEPYYVAVAGNHFVYSSQIVKVYRA